MKTRQIFGWVLLAAVLLTACSKKGPSYAKYVPKSAGYVLAFDLKRLTQKLEQDSLTFENMLTVINEDKSSKAYTEALSKWNEFKDAGVDFEQKVLVAVPALDVTAGSVSFQLVAGLKDPSKLEAFIAKQKDAPKIEKEGNLSMVDMNGVVLGWNKEAVMLVGAQSTPSYDLLNDSTDAPIDAVPGAEGEKALLKKYFDLKKDESVLSLDEFGQLMEDPADVAVFTNSESMTGTQVNPLMATMQSKLKDLLQGMYSTTKINFEQGKIVVESNSFIGTKMGDLLKKFAGPVVDMSLVERYPSANMNGVAAFSFKPELIPAFLQETGFDALAGVAMAEAGVTVDDVIKAFKGDFAIMFSDFAIQHVDQGKDAAFKAHMPVAKVLMAVRIGDKAAFEKLLNTAAGKNLIRREGNRIYPGGEELNAAVGNSVFVGIENDLLVVASDSAIYAGYAAATTGAALKPAAASAIKGKSLGFYVDASSILQGISNDVFDSTDVHMKNILDRSRGTFKEMWFNTSNFDGKKISSYGELVLADQKNALPQLVRFLMYAADEVKLQQKQEEIMYQKMENMEPEKEQP
jgi:hypothetical protein